MSRRSIPALVLAASLVALGATACQAGGGSTTPASTASGTIDTQSCITDFDPNKDYFPDKVTLSDAQKFTVEYHNSYKVVTVKEPLPGAAPETYVLVQCGAPEPHLEGELAKAEKVTIPTKRVVAGSTTHITGFLLTDSVDRLVAVGSAPKVYDGPVREAIDAGRITDAKSDGTKLSVETIAATRPDLVMQGGTADPAYGKLRDLGLKVVANAEFLEGTPLGRAEWVKFTALFLNAESRANDAYRQIKTDYESVAARARSAHHEPTVLSGLMNKGIFYAAGDESYVAALVRDAGASLILGDDVKGAGNPQVGLEVVLAKGAAADFWINAASAHWDSTAVPVQDDPRLAELAPVSNGHIWNYTRRINAAGGNDYWQTGVTRPDLVLADLVAIFHPDEFPNHEFTYYELVPRP